MKAGRAFIRALLFPVMVATVALLSALLSACRPAVELHISIHPWIGYETLQLASEFGWLPAGVLIHRSASATESAQRIMDGSAQAAALTLDEALRLRERRPRLAVVLVMNESAGADVILARPEIAGLSDLAGARIAYEASAVGELLLGSALEAAGLKEGDIERVDLPLSEHEAAYKAGAIDAVVSYPPSSDRIVAQGAELVYDSSQLPGSIFDVLVVDRALMSNREELLVATIAAHFRALEHLRTNREDTVYRYAQYQAVPSASIRKSLAGVRLPGSQAVQGYLQEGGAVERAAVRMIEAAVLPVGSAVLDDLVVNRYLPGDKP